MSPGFHPEIWPRPLPYLCYHASCSCKSQRGDKGCVLFLVVLGLFFRTLLFLYARVLFFLLLVGRTTRHRATRPLRAVVMTPQSRAVRFERLPFGYYCSAAAKNRLACTELLSGPGLPTERVHPRSYLTLPCYCSAAAMNRSACTERLFGPGLPTERVHTRFELKLPRYCSAAANSRFACTELLSGPGLPTDRAHARFELELPCYCSCTAAKSRFACAELLSGHGLPTERVHARFGLKLSRYRSTPAISRFFCTELLGLLLVLLTLGCSESLWVVLNVTCLTL